MVRFLGVCDLRFWKMTFALLFVVAFRYYSNTTIILTKDVIKVNRRIPLGFTYNNKRNPNNLSRIREYLNMGDGESIAGVELVFKGEWNLVLGQHLGKEERQWLIRKLSQLLYELR